MQNYNFKGIPTSLFLNGPKLGIVTDPQSQTDVIGVATFTGIATASFPNPTDGVNDGSIEINWYFDGSRILDTSEDSTSNAEIVGFSSAIGTGSTITINGLTTDDNTKEVYFTADYIPSAYSQPDGSAVTAGTARSTGNAFNEPIQSGIATITVFPFIEITSQPSGQLVSIDDDARYTIAAQKTPGGGSVEYQWQLNGVDLSDGTTTRTVIEGGAGKLAITSDAGDDTEVDFSQVSSYDSFVTGRTYTLTANANITTKLFATGGGGGGSDVRSVTGSKGGLAEGTFIFVKDQEYKLIVGSGGDIVTAGRPGGGTGGGSRGSSGRGGGGGYTGLFEGSIAHANAIIIGGGGGGSTGDVGYGGAGGGNEGNAGSNGGRAGLGGTQTAGGSGKGSSGSGSALQGGDGSNAGAGGGGYYGGGGGNPSGTISDGAGGGGSGYIGGVTDGTNTTAGGASSNGGSGADGSFRIEFTAASKEVATTVTGSNTTNLTINAEATANATIKCKVTASEVQESPVFSNTVSYVVVEPRSLLEIETYNYTDATATLSEFDLANGDLTIDYATYSGNVVCLYAGDKDIDVEMEIYGGKGSDNGSNPGGEGGKSTIRFTMERNVEHILTGLFDAVNAPFLYRKATLIACVGEGGDAGSVARGGFAGGIGIGGEDGFGSGGSGGERIDAGTLPSNGIFGSATSITAVTPDTVAVDRDGGRTLPCPKGVYWRDQGKSTCEDLGTVKFRTPNGTEISNTAEIVRGYKSGYNITQTKGAGDGGGNGGSGSTGGQGGTSNGGGGGGSGYTDGSVTVIDTQVGGSTGASKVIIRIADPNTIDPSTTLQNVTFTVGRSAAFSNVITFVKESGSGPDRIAFGPNSGTVTVSMGAGAIYNLESTTINGAPGGSLRLSNGVLQLEDSGDNDFNDLTVTPNSGQFTSSTRYQF